MVTVAGVIANNVPRRRHDICFSRVGGWGGLVRLGSWAASSGRGEGSNAHTRSSELRFQMNAASNNQIPHARIAAEREPKRGKDLTYPMG